MLILIRVSYLIRISQAHIGKQSQFIFAMSDSKKKYHTLADYVELGDNPEILDYWTLSFSPKQQCFHSEKLRVMILENVRQLIRTDGQCVDFMIVGIAKELEDLRSIREKLEGKWKRKLHLLSDEKGRPVRTKTHKNGSIYPYE